MTVAELEDRMGVGELERWKAFERVEPFLPFRTDLAAGIVASTVANVNRGRNSAAFEPLDFMPLQRELFERAELERHRAALMPDAVDEDDAMIQRMVVAFGGRAA
jgi:hypothetical protein